MKAAASFVMLGMMSFMVIREAALDGVCCLVNLKIENVKAGRTLGCAMMIEDGDGHSFTAAQVLAFLVARMASKATLVM